MIPTRKKAKKLSQGQGSQQQQQQQEPARKKRQWQCGKRSYHNRPITIELPSFSSTVDGGHSLAAVEISEEEQQRLVAESLIKHNGVPKHKRLVMMRERMTKERGHKILKPKTIEQYAPHLVDFEVRDQGSQHQLNLATDIYEYPGFARTLILTLFGCVFLFLFLVLVLVLFLGFLQCKLWWRLHDHARKDRKVHDC